jgi:transposase-like protein
MIPAMTTPPSTSSSPKAHRSTPSPTAPSCSLVIVGVRADGTEKLVAIADGYRESTQSWADLLRDCKRRGLGAPVVIVGDGALGM